MDLENLISKIIKNNEVDENENNGYDKKEILVIGDIYDYRERMTKNYIKFMDYLKDNFKKYKIIYYGNGIEGFQPNQPLVNVIKKFTGGGDERQPLVWICDMRGLNSVIGINNYTGIKILDIEDLYGKMDYFISRVVTDGIKYVTYHYESYVFDKFLNFAEKEGIKCYQRDHYIDDNIFQNLNHEKKIDVLCFGNIDPRFYTFRKRLFELLMNQKDFRVLMLKHPTYDYENGRFHNIIEEKLCSLINQSWITIVTPSNLEFLLMKYHEVALSHGCIAGRLPKRGGQKYEGCLIELTEEMSDDEIIERIKDYLRDLDEVERLSEKGYQVAKNNYTYKQGVIRIEEIFDQIYDDFHKSVNL